MTARVDVLRQAMDDTDTTQSELARVSGVRQPSISGFLSGRVAMSDEQLDRLLGCLGYRLEVTRRAVRPELTRSERRSWLLHRRLSRLMTEPQFAQWQPHLLANVERVRRGVQGRVHLDHVEQWRALVDRADLGGMRRAMTGLDRRAIEMREVSPFSGLLPNDERLAVPAELGNSRRSAETPARTHTTRPHPRPQTTHSLRL